MYLTEREGAIAFFLVVNQANAFNRVIEIIEKGLPVNELYTIAKFAKLAGVPVSTIRYRVHTGKLKPVAYTNSGYMQFAEEQKELINKT